MDFKEFIHRLASVISAGGNTAAFTRSVFEAILSEEGQDILDLYAAGSVREGVQLSSESRADASSEKGYGIQVFLDHGAHRALVQSSCLDRVPAVRERYGDELRRGSHQEPRERSSRRLLHVPRFLCQKEQCAEISGFDARLWQRKCESEN